MKKNFKFTALLLTATLLLSSCIGSFRLTNNIKDWNEGLGDKFMNEVVFVALHVVPVYPIALFVDGVVLNSVEFWTGESLVAEPGETKIVKNAQGVDVQVTALENGYTISDGKTAMNLIYDENEQVWSAQYGDQTVNLVKLNSDNTAQLYVGDTTVDITLDAEGVNKAQMFVNDYAMNN